MPHETETDFRERVVARLEETYGRENVTENLYMQDSQRFADVFVEGPVIPLAIEIENDFEDAVTGIGQSILYAAGHLNAVPVVVVPGGHVDQPEADYFRQYGIPVVEMDV